LALEATGLETVQQLREALEGVAQPAQGLSTAFTAIYAVVGAIIFKLATYLLSLAGILLKAVGGFAAVGKAAGVAVATLARWVGLASAGSAAGLALAAGFLYVAQNALSAAKAIEELNAALDKQMAESYETQSKFRGKAASVQTTEDRRNVLQEIDAEIEQKEKDLRDKEAEAIAAREYSDSLSVGTSLVGTRTQAAAEAQAAETSAGIARTELMGLRAQRGLVATNRDSSGRSRGPLGLEREQEQQARERMMLEKQIRDDAFASAQSAADPQMQVRMAETERRRSQARLKRAEEASKVNPEERAALDQATASLAPGEADAEKLRQGIERIKAVKATTESSRLSRDVAVRQSLADQTQQIEEESGLNLSVEQRNALEARRKVVDEQVNALGGREQISGGRIQELQRRRDFAAAQEDPNAARQADESARNQVQAANEAEAAQKALNAAKEKTLALENQLAGISGSGAQADEAATIESENRTEALQKALTAAKALAAAQEQYAQARESGSTEAQDQARAGVEQASVAAAAAGVDGRGVQEIQSALNIEQQILQANLQQARITQAAAQARVEAAQRQLNTEKMLAQMAQKSAEANVNNTSPQQDQTRAQIESDAAQADIAAEERALAAAKAKDAAEKALVANPNEANRRALEQANVAAEAAGVGSRTPAEVQADLDSKRVAAANQEAERIDAAQTEAERIKLASLRAQEQYGPNKDQARRDADALEDSMAKEARTKELGETIKDPAIAAGLASAEVEMARAMSNIERTGQPEMGEMASVGGSAGFGGLVNDNSKDLKAIKENAEKIKTLMDTFKTQQETALTDNKRVIAMAEAEMSQ
jgi:colicin import membrane protein